MVDTSNLGSGTGHWLINSAISDGGLDIAAIAEVLRFDEPRKNEVLDSMRLPH